MICIKKKSECCGCYGCVNVCPRQCINMKIDNEGFWYPEVDKEECIDCNLCKKVCPVITTPRKEEFDSIAYACKNKNEKVRLKSSSGGVFSNLYEHVINNGGVVFGAAFNDSFEVEHMQAIKLKECEKFRGSKYVQSKIGETYKSAKRHLDEGKIVLFSGTQCQIKGLNLFLSKKYENLIAIDIVCHGVPSPLVFDIYKKNLKNEYNSEIKGITFRDKRNSWKNYRYKITFNNEKVDDRLFTDNIYSKGFLSDLYLRPSCYSCKAKNFTSSSDITLADYWGVQNKHPEFDDDKGVSLILVNSEKGEFVLNEISDCIEFMNTDLDYAISKNPCILRPVKYNDKREVFFKNLNNENLEELIYKYTKTILITKIRNKVKCELCKMKNIVVKYRN